MYAKENGLSFDEDLETVQKDRLRKMFKSQYRQKFEGMTELGPGPEDNYQESELKSMLSNTDDKAKVELMLKRKQEKLRQAELSGSEDEGDEELFTPSPSPLSRDQKIAIMRQALASEGEQKPLNSFYA